MKKSNRIAIFMIALFSVMLVGCKKEDTVAEIEVETEEVNMFGLTDEEQKMYAEYAAGVLMKYNAGSNMRVLEGQTLRNQEAKEEAAREQAARREQLAAEYASNKNSSSKKENQSSGGSSSGGASQGISYISDMSEATGTGAFSITYTGYEIADSYPTSGEDMLMAIDASQGKTLLITKFLVNNISNQTENFDMFSKQAKFKIKVDGKTYKSQYTLLLDDLSMYKGEVEAGSIMENVLVFEIPESIGDNINNMELTVTVGDNVSNMLLTGGSVTRTETVQTVETEQENMEATEEDEVTEESSDTMGIEEDLSDDGGNVTVVGSNNN